LKLDQQTHKTAVCRKGGKQPHWGESCILTVRGDEQEQVLRVRVYSKGVMGKAIVGTALIPIDALISVSMASASQTGRLRAVSSASAPAPPTPSRAAATSTTNPQVGPKAFPVTPGKGLKFEFGDGKDELKSRTFEDDDLYVYHLASLHFIHIDSCYRLWLLVCILARQ
jgi:hypothetical protein